MLIETLSVGPYGTNCYLWAATHGGCAVVIDPGDDGVRILRRVKDLVLDVTCIVLTHGHHDHTGALKELKDATGAEIAMHVADADMLRNNTLAAMLGLKACYPLPPDKQLEDGQKVVVGGVEFSVLHTPGHSRGSICLLGDGVVFTGDTLFQAGIGRTDLPGGNYTELIDSIESKLLSLPDNTRVYPGHGPSTTIGDEKRNNPFFG